MWPTPLAHWGIFSQVTQSRPALCGRPPFPCDRKLQLPGPWAILVTTRVTSPGIHAVSGNKPSALWEPGLLGDSASTWVSPVTSPSLSFCRNGVRFKGRKPFADWKVIDKTGNVLMSLSPFEALNALSGSTWLPGSSLGV